MHGRGDDPNDSDPGPTGIRITLSDYRLRKVEELAADNAERLTKLEAWKNWIFGVAAAIGIALGTFAKQAVSYLTGHP